ncbi:MAG TPA: PQQ-binding-like beta-propeller repeat protein, partial [Anaeromyxobacter sp.]
MGMIRIRTGTSWRHDPALRAALRRASGPARAAAARAVVDALALEVDGIDISAGRAEGPLLPSLEALLRAIARVVAGAPHATVAFPDGEIEVLLRRRGPAVLVTVVAVSRPSRILARDVEVEADDLAAAALEACACLCRELAEVLPEGASREARRLRAAARDLRRVEARPAPRPRSFGPGRAPRAAQRAGRAACLLELGEDDGLLAAYEGGRPDLGSLLVPGRVTLLAPGGAQICAVPGLPFLALRDLGAASEGLIAAVRRGEPAYAIPLARMGRAAPASLAVDLANGTIAAPGGAPVRCSPLEVARAFAEAAAELGRVARSRNPRQAENAYLAELEASAADRLAQIEELAEGDRADLSGAPARAAVARPPTQRALGPGKLRRLSFRRAFGADAGAPAGDGLLLAGGVVAAAGSAAFAAMERATGALLWRAEGCAFAAALPGAFVVARGGAVSALALRTGAALWTRPLPGALPTAAVALARGPFVLVEPGALTGLDPGSGRTLWRFEPPGAARIYATAFGGIAAAAADTGFLYGLDAAGRVAWRLRAPGPFERPPSAAGGRCLAAAVLDPGLALLAVDPASGSRSWEAPLDFVPAGAPVPWGGRIVVAGAMAGDPAVTVLDRSGAASWTAAPPLLAGAPALAVAGAVLVVRDPRGAVVALGRDGGVRWSRPARADHPRPGIAAPAVARGTVVVPAGEGLAALDARTGEIVGAIPGVSPSRIAIDAALTIAAMDADGLASGWRIATHLS